MENNLPVTNVSAFSFSGERCKLLPAMRKPIHIPVLDFLPLDTDCLGALLADPAVFLAKLGDSGLLKDQIVAVAQQTQARQASNGAEPPWIGYLAQDPDSGDIVGSCGYNGNPDDAGFVEMTYFTFPEFEGVGVATGMAQELLARAFAEASVNGVFACTKAKRDAAAHVLEKVGLQCVGQAEFPDTGRVWRWELRR